MPCKISVPVRFCPATSTVVEKFTGLLIVGLYTEYLKSCSNLASKKFAI